MAGMRTLKNNKGFTLVELAIVLVIIGILLGGIIKGQELIKNAKYKRLYSTYREVIASVYSYYDKYGKYPGDDNTAATRWGATYGAVNGNGNGFIDGGVTWCLASSASENCYAWQDLRIANILTGATDAANGRIAPNHPFGGRVAVIRTSVVIGGWNKPFAVCFEWLSNETAQWLDTNYDDGNFATGSIRGSGDYTGGLPDALASQYTCIEG
jgi:prepilin-type N-terminal cleavage/methylation domain-containing protein